MFSSVYSVAALASAALASAASAASATGLHCTQYYTARPGDTCIGIVQKFNYAFSVNDFIRWNPSVGSDCRTMYAGNSYCVCKSPSVL